MPLTKENKEPETVRDEHEIVIEKSVPISEKKKLHVRQTDQ